MGIPRGCTSKRHKQTEPLIAGSGGGAFAGIRSETSPEFSDLSSIIFVLVCVLAVDCAFCRFLCTVTHRCLIVASLGAVVNNYPALPLYQSLAGGDVPPGKTMDRQLCA